MLGPDFANRIETRARSYLRQGARKGFIEVTFVLRTGTDPEAAKGEFAVGLEISEGITTFEPMKSEDMTVGEYNCAGRLDALRRRENDNFGFFCAYGALRTFTDPSALLPSQDHESIERLRPLFDPRAPVSDPDLLAKLLSGDFSNFRKVPAKGLDESVADAMRRHIHDLLPNSAEMASNKCSILPLLGNSIPICDLSDGYASLLSLVGHLFRYSLPASDWKRDPASIQGMLLIDEIDAHLHPSWQIRILSDLRKVFPNLQIIATTHSPMVVGSIQIESVRLLRRGDSGVEVLADLPSVQGWRADQILTSILFDLETTRDQRTQDDLRSSLISSLSAVLKIQTYSS